jgi:hypothetical protein
MGLVPIPTQIKFNIQKISRFVRGTTSFLALLLLLQGCAPSGGQIEDTALPANQSESSELSSLAMQKIYVSEAYLEQIKPNKADCPQEKSHNSTKICIRICHVPPGNSSEAHIKVIPLEALSAHLNHGHNNLEDQDYLGDCLKDVPMDLAPIDITNGTITDGTTDSGTDVTTGSVTDVIPLWCQAYIDVDQNCDGYNDLTGDPLL